MIRLISQVKKKRMMAQNSTHVPFFVIFESGNTRIRKIMENIYDEFISTLVEHIESDSNAYEYNGKSIVQRNVGTPAISIEQFQDYKNAFVSTITEKNKYSYADLCESCYTYLLYTVFNTNTQNSRLSCTAFRRIIRSDVIRKIWIGKYIAVHKLVDSETVAHAINDMYTKNAGLVLDNLAFVTQFAKCNKDITSRANIPNLTKDHTEVAFSLDSIQMCTLKDLIDVMISISPKDAQKQKKQKYIHDHIAKLEVDACSFEQRVSKLENGIEQRFSKLKSDIEQRFSKLESDIEQRFIKLESDIEQRFTKLESNIEQRFTKLESDIEQRLWSQFSSQIEELRSLITESEASYESEASDGSELSDVPETPNEPATSNEPGLIARIFDYFI